MVQKVPGMTHKMGQKGAKRGYYSFNSFGHAINQMFCVLYGHSRLMHLTRPLLVFGFTGFNIGLEDRPDVLHRGHIWLWVGQLMRAIPLCFLHFCASLIRCSGSLSFCSVHLPLLPKAVEADGSRDFFFIDGPQQRGV